LRLWRILSLWAPVAAYMVGLFLVSSRTHDVSIPSGWDKVVHVGAYSVLGVLALRAFHGGLHRITPLRAFGAVLLTVGYGVLDELQQGRVVGRHASALDWAADVAGAALAVAFLGALVALRVRRKGIARSRAIEGEP